MGPKIFFYKSLSSRSSWCSEVIRHKYQNANNYPKDASLACLPSWTAYLTFARLDPSFIPSFCTVPWDIDLCWQHKLLCLLVSLLLAKGSSSRVEGRRRVIWGWLFLFTAPSSCTPPSSPCLPSLVAQLATIASTRVPAIWGWCLCPQLCGQLLDYSLLRYSLGVLFSARTWLTSFFFF